MLTGYLWAESLSDDMFTLFKKDPMNAKTGALYRERILQPGGSKDGHDLVASFLGREPNSDAFTKRLFGCDSKL